tara:strand:+ start:556 stop:915 length:360 start_codon:yes stop_codon:yes gene_type:complete
MDYNSIIKNYTEEQKDMIVSLSKLNEITVQQTDKYHTGALNAFFDLWKESFPGQKQNKGCVSCRKAVFLLFNKVASLISSDRLKAEVKLEEFNETLKKTKKAKKHITRTGALSPTGARN